jgi:xanthine dehydrogenase accessory factor
VVRIVSVDSHGIEESELGYRMADVLTELVAGIEQQGKVVLATIVSSDGSSPLPAGAMMLVRSDNGEIVGSVGGGLLEALVVEEAKKYFVESRPPRVGTFDLNDDVSNEGMICGGSVDVLLEPITHADAEVFPALLSARNGGTDCVLLRVVVGADKNVHRLVLTTDHDIIPEAILSRAGVHAGVLSDAIHHSFGREDLRRIKTDRGEIIIQPIHGLQDLIIFGGGHVSKYLAPMAAIAGFSTTVIDDREEFANAERFPVASRVLASEYDKAFSKIEVRPSTFIVIVTRGHQSDEGVLKSAIRTPARYVGMIGSKRKVIASYKHLIEQGVPIADLKRVHAPIGLDIGAVSAEEIAVSIVAEIIRVRRGFDGVSRSLFEQLAQWFDNGRGKLSG